MNRIFLVEDDPGIAGAIAESLTGWGMEVRTVRDFRRVAEECAEYAPHLVLMDIKLPFMDGYHWCGQIRRTSSVPILFLSSAADNMNIVMAINMGGDEFIAKPFDLSVLVAKVQALLRRTYDYANAAPVLEHAGLLLDTGEGTVSYHGEKVPLTRNEYRILLTLMKDKGKVVSREKLMEALWETDSFVDENTLTVNVGRLRKKLEGLGLSGCIATRFGQGYILGADA